MTIQELITVLEDKLVQLNKKKETIATVDILVKLDNLAREVRETEEALNKLRTLA